MIIIKSAFQLRLAYKSASWKVLKKIWSKIHAINFFNEFKFSKLRIWLFEGNLSHLIALFYAKLDRDSNFLSHFLFHIMDLLLLWKSQRLCKTWQNRQKFTRPEIDQRLHHAAMLGQCSMYYLWPKNMKVRQTNSWWCYTFFSRYMTNLTRFFCPSFQSTYVSRLDA